MICNKRHPNLLHRRLLPTVVLGLLGSCLSDASEVSPREDTTAVSAAAFTDITQDAGIRFEHFNAASPERRLPETMGSGAAFFDYDGDGLADLYLVNFCRIEERSGPSGSLYRNLGEGRFRDVTSGSGLDQSFCGMGAAVADYDNDGDIDLFLSGLFGHRLYSNLGRGRFQEVARELGINDREFGSAAAFLDFNQDGFLDLFVGRYVRWSPETDIPCSPDGKHRIYCTPEQYPPLSSLLYRNLGGVRFEDVTEASGIGAVMGKALGVAVFDHNRDGRPDLAVANDTVRNFLFLNQVDGTFDEVGVETGIAFSESGAARGGMGIDAGDFDADGVDDLLIGNFSQEMAGFYRGSPAGFYIDAAAQLGLGIPTLMTLTFGALLDDFNGDGRPDVLLVNGHIEPNIAETRPALAYAQSPQLFLNDESSSFSPAGGNDGEILTPLVARGLATADIDLDGDLDLVITQNGRSARLIRNLSQPRRWLRVSLQAATGCVTPYGAAVTTVTASGKTYRKTLQSGGSYLSASEPVLTFAFESQTELMRLEVQWPSGRRETIDSPRLNRTLTLRESSR